MLDDKEKSKEDVFDWKGEELKLDYICDNLPLGFEKPMSSRLQMMESQDPMEKINMGTEEIESLHMLVNC